MVGDMFCELMLTSWWSKKICGLEKVNMAKDYRPRLTVLIILLLPHKVHICAANIAFCPWLVLTYISIFWSESRMCT